MFCSDNWEQLETALSGTAGLIFSVTPLAIHTLSPAVVTSLRHLLALGELHDGIRRIISCILAEDIRCDSFAISALDPMIYGRGYDCQVTHLFHPRHLISSHSLSHCNYLSFRMS